MKKKETLHECSYDPIQLQDAITVANLWQIQIQNLWSNNFIRVLLWERVIKRYFISSMYESIWYIWVLKVRFIYCTLIIINNNIIIFFLLEIDIIIEPQ